MKNYELFYVDKSNRIECMLVCSLKKRIDWCEDGLKLASWKYELISKGKADNLNEIFKKHANLNIDHRRKKQIRTINIGDSLDNFCFWICKSSSIFMEKSFKLKIGK